LKSIDTLLRKLTFDDLDDWVGGTILNRGKRYVKNVYQLCRTQDNVLVAWVDGSDRYTTSVCIDTENDFDYFCTCPYSWGPCKHTVAVILAAAQQVRDKQPIAMLEEGDALSLALSACANEEEDGWEDEELLRSSKPWRSKALAEVKKVLEKKSRKVLLDQLIDLADRYPEIRRQILETEQLASGQVEKLIRSLLSEIINLTAEPIWYNRWSGENNLPDYPRLGERLQALVNEGHADAVLELGIELWNRGNTQVGQSDDNGETGMAIAACMDTVLTALPLTSLSPPEQLLWVIDRMQEDDFCILDGSAEKLLQQNTYTRTDWREVAGTLETRLHATPKTRGSSFPTGYRRKNLLNQLLDAYSYAGWKDRIIPLLEIEVDTCREYTRLVDELLAAGEQDRARHWCIIGYRRTEKNSLGIAWILQQQLRKMAQNEQQFDLAAAYKAQDFFQHPSGSEYNKLCEASKKAKCWPTVQSAVFHYLETGQQPTPADRDKLSNWPLPCPEVGPAVTGKQSNYHQFPDLTTLIDIAILEKRFDDVVELYERLCTTGNRGLETGKDVARAVGNTHPQTALDIWRNIVDKLIGKVKPRAYEEAAVYLRFMEKIYLQNNRLADWQDLIRELRKEHRQKRSLLGTLDNLSKKKIVN